MEQKLWLKVNSQLRKRSFLKNSELLLGVREKTLNNFKRKMVLTKNFELEPENSKKVIDIVEEILNFNKQQKGKGLPLNFESENLKILSLYMLQRLPIAFTQVQAGKTSKNVLNEIREIIYSLFQATEITKKVYNNILNSAKV